MTALTARNKRRFSRRDMWRPRRSLFVVCEAQRSRFKAFPRWRAAIRAGRGPAFVLRGSAVGVVCVGGCGDEHGGECDQLFAREALRGHVEGRVVVFEREHCPGPWRSVRRTRIARAPAWPSSHIGPSVSG